MKRALRAIPRYAYGARPGSTVVAIGHVRTVEPEIDGLLSARPCIAFRSRIYRGSVDGPIYAERVGLTAFAIDREDGTTVAVASTHARFVFPALPLPDDAPDRCVELALACNVAKSALPRCIFEEVLVLEGMRVAVAGRLAEDGRLVGDLSNPIIIGVPF